MHIENYLNQFNERWFGFSNAIKKIKIQNQIGFVEIIFGYPVPQVLKEEMIHTLKASFQAEEKVPKEKIQSLEIEILCRVKSHAVNQTCARSLLQVKNIIAIASCKGGVGKSTTAVNLACSLKKMGVNVGLLDADVYGPNLPQMLGIPQKTEVTPQKKFQPLNYYGLSTLSLGNLVDVNTPMIWRGPMASKAFEQLLYDTLWPDLDYLVVDLPPGTGDIQLTLAQKMPITGVVMVTTPQSVALLDVRKGIEMFQKVNVPILGIIENMSLYQCAHCGHLDPIFGEGGGSALADAYQVPFVGSLPLTRCIREAGDKGQPIVMTDKQPDITRIYQEAAYKIAAQIDSLPISYAGKFPNIRIENE